MAPIPSYSLSFLFHDKCSTTYALQCHKPTGLNLVIMMHKSQKQFSKL